MLFSFMLPVCGLAADGILAVPSAPAFTVASGDEDGEIILTVTALPSWGDLTVPGDGDGVAGILEWWNEVDGWQTLSDPAATGAHTFTLSPLLWGTTTTVRVRGVSAAGVDGIAAGATGQVPPVATIPGLGAIWPDDDTVWPDDDTIWPAEEV